MSLIDKCKALLLDQHPERDETHSALYRCAYRARAGNGALLPSPRAGRRQDQAGLCEGALMDELERRIADLKQMEDDDRRDGNNSLADVWRIRREKAEAKRKREKVRA